VPTIHPLLGVFRSVTPAFCSKPIRLHAGAVAGACLRVADDGVTVFAAVSFFGPEQPVGECADSDECKDCTDHVRVPFIWVSCCRYRNPKPFNRVIAFILALG